MAKLLSSDDRDSLYRQLRDAGPVTPCRYFDGTLVWLVTGHAEALVVLTDSRLSNDSSASGGISVSAASGVSSDVGRYFSGHMLDRDPPEHTRLRSLVSRAFTARRVVQLRPRIEQVTDTLLAGARAEEPFDLVAGLARLVPIRVICDLLGVPADQQERWVQHSRALTAMDASTPAAAAGLVAAAKHVIEIKRQQPDDRLVSALIQARDEDGDRLDGVELVTTVMSLLGTGNESSVGLLSSGLASLLTRPALAGALRADPGRVPAAVEELLRFFTPFELSGLRYTREELQLGGTTLPAGAAVQVVLAAADRDPRAFSDPETLDVWRPDSGGHLAFGHGLHYCLGAALARSQAEIVLATVLRTFPEMTLAVAARELRWRNTFVRGPESLPVWLWGTR